MAATGLFNRFSQLAYRTQLNLVDELFEDLPAVKANWNLAHDVHRLLHEYQGG